MKMIINNFTMFIWFGSNPVAKNNKFSQMKRYSCLHIISDKYFINELGGKNLPPFNLFDKQKIMLV